ncbi:ATP-binding protein [Planktotalea sp.]|uniref:ATP-binding protein n=1 Tax=Planktotalea sp. TaxID=2029877 RepID=UPI0025D9A38D|nr:ATP-binding protein [Planktotalea sp.]
MNLLIGVSLGYVLALFIVAFAAERAARIGRIKWLRAPFVYTLSLSIYCTAWTFYGAVGFAVRSGLEFVTIYLGPSLVMLGWLWAVRKLVRIGRTQRITSIADLISARFGKSNLLAVTLTILAVTGTTPYIALQLQSVTQSYAVFAEASQAGFDVSSQTITAFWVAIGLALFTILFGTRKLDVNERHDGVVMAIAVEAVVKLIALMAVGIFVVWGLSGGIGPMLEKIDSSDIGTWNVSGGRWAGLTFLSAAAFLCLPRMFHVMVVENDDEQHLRMASWAFPAYLLLMSLFVLPIAVTGLDLLPAGSNPDMFVLTVPLSQGQNGLAMLSFLGGLSSATSMVIVASIALSTMVSNHIVMPIWLHFKEGRVSISGDVRSVVLLSRRLAIGAIVMLAYFYFRLSGGGSALAAIGLVSFVGVAQALPVMVGGIFWRGATRTGALAGLAIGFFIWAYSLFLPSLGTGVVFSEMMMTQGPFGIEWLAPQALFGIKGLDPILHCLMWSMLLNSAAFCLMSLSSFPEPLERLQGAQFVNVFQHGQSARSWANGAAQSEDLMIMSQRILGSREAQSLFGLEAARQGSQGLVPEPTPEFLDLLERELSGSVGAATAHAMVGQIVGGASVSVDDLLAVADESAQMMEYSSKLEAQSSELQRTAQQLRLVNEKLTQISVQKDGFLSQISHELRTPMTSIRAFSEILRDSENMPDPDKARYAGIIHSETLRLTRLLDDLLDLSVLEDGRVSLNLSRKPLSDILDGAISAAGLFVDKGIQIKRKPQREKVMVHTDTDRLSQVFINILSNSQKYCDVADPTLTIKVFESEDLVTVDFIDNGSVIAADMRDVIFEKFSRVGETKAGGAGLGLAICREIMNRLGGEILYLPGQGGSAFRVQFPNEFVPEMTIT